MLLLTLVLCTPGKQFWQPCRKVCHKMAMVFRPTYENYFKKPKCCHGHVESSFDNPMKKHSTEGRKLFDRGPNKKNNESFTLKFFSPQNVSCDTLKPVLTNLKKIFWRKAEYFRSMSESNEKNQRKIFSLNGSYGHVLSFDNPSEKFLTKSRECSH